MRGHRSGSVVPVALRWAERVLVVVGCLLLAVSALFLADAALSQRAARQSLQAMARINRPTPAKPAAAPDPGLPPLVDVRRGSPIAELSISRLGLSTIVLQGSDAKTLLRGPGHLEKTALPGEIGNAVIAGHRDSFFRPLRDVRIGDDVTVETPRARFHYRVTSTRVVDPHDVSVLRPTQQATLTLITCYPFWVLGRAPDRFIVRAVRTDAPGSDHSVEESGTPESVEPGALAPGPAAFVDGKARPVVGDEALVRRAVEQFRLAYNARLASHDEGSPLGLQACEVAIENDRATATCKNASPARRFEADVRTFTFARVDDGWAIRSIVIGPETGAARESASSPEESADRD